MNITGNKVVINQTYRFLFPILNLYGEEFKKRIAMLHKQGIFIDDIMNIRYDDNDYLHIVVNVPKTIQRHNKEFICETINWLREEGYMPKNYILDVIAENKKPQHIVLMILIPEKYQGCIDLFLRGESNLFENQDVNKCFQATNKANEGYFAFCRKTIISSKKININLSDEVLNY